MQLQAWYVAVGSLRFLCRQKIFSVLANAQENDQTFENQDLSILQMSTNVR